MPEDYVLAAVRKGFSAIGFTSHAPVPFCTDWTMKPENLDKYIENINDLKKNIKIKYRFIQASKRIFIRAQPISGIIPASISQ